MTNGKRQTAALIAVSLLLSAALGFVGGRTSRPVAETLTRTDTLRFRDTLTVELPVPILTTIIDTILVVRPDIIVIRDTVYARLPKERKEYSGADYRAVVSGYQPSLDLIQVFPETKTITKTISAPPRKRSHWSIALQAGYGLTLQSNRITPLPYIGAGLSYNIIEW